MATMPHSMLADEIPDTPALHVDVIDLPPLSKPDEFAAYLGVSIKHLERMVRDKRIVMPILVGDRKRWRRSDVLNWLESKSAAASNGTDPSDTRNGKAAR